MKAIGGWGLLLATACQGTGVELVVERPADLDTNTALQVTVYAPGAANPFDCESIAFTTVLKPSISDWTLFCVALES